MDYRSFAGPPTRRTERWALLATIAAITVFAAAALAVRLPAVPVRGVLPFLMGSIVVTELISAYLFLSLLMRTGAPSAACATAAYLLSAAAALPYLVLFPDVFTRGVPFGGSVQSSFELWILWHAGYPVLIAGYALLERYGARPFFRPRRAAAVTVVACLALVAAVGWYAVRPGAQPAMLLAGTTFTPLSVRVILPLLCALDVMALAALWLGSKLRSAVHLWLAVAVYCSMLDAILGVASARYASEWYVGKVLALISSAAIVVLFLRAFMGMYRDVIRSYGELSRTREREAAQVRTLGRIGGWELDVRSGAIRWSDELDEIFALEPGSVHSRETYAAMIHPDDRAALSQRSDPSRSIENREFAYRLIAGDQSVRTIEGRAEPEFDANGVVVRWAGTIADITERRAIEEHLASFSVRDGATDLPNRVAFRARLQQAVAKRTPGGHPIAVMVVGIDRFRQVNDAIGHIGGDLYLRAVGQRLASAVGAGFVARGNGDEFTVVYEDGADREDAAVFARRLLKAASSATMIFTREFSLSVSIGIALFPNDGETADELIRCSEVAMYEAKAAGRNTVAFCASGMREEQVERAAFEGDIRTALRTQAFHLEYQPIVDARDGTVFGAEALLRWEHPIRGAVPPTLVIEAAERNGLMGRLGAWILSEGIRQRARWDRIGMSFTLALNVSVDQLQNRDFSLLLGRMLASNGVASSAIELEITESAAMDGALVADQMRACNELGVRFSLDDFGTHYSSLTYLQRLQIDRIKIDRSFVRELPTNQNDAAIVKAVIELAHSLGRTVIAEGVEEARQMDWLREAGCDFVQGYHIARAMPAAVFDRWFAQRGKRTARLER